MCARSKCSNCNHCWSTAEGLTGRARSSRMAWGVGRPSICIIYTTATNKNCVGNRNRADRNRHNILYRANTWGRDNKCAHDCCRGSGANMGDQYTTAAVYNNGHYHIYIKYNTKFYDDDAAAGGHARGSILLPPVEVTLYIYTLL